MHETVLQRRGRGPTPTRRPSLPVAPRVAQAVLVAVLAAGGLAVVVLWWKDTVPGTLRAPGGLMTAAGRVVGLLAGYLLVAQVALTARIPQLERMVGTDRRSRVHRAVGEYLVCLLVAHAALLAVGYAQADRVSLPHEVGVLLSDYPHVLAATVALGLLVVVGVSSARAVRRALSYEMWYVLHLSTYAAAGLAFLHQLANGADFTDNQLARMAWSAMHAMVAAAVVMYRVVLPVRQALRHRLVVSAVVPEAPGVVSLYLTGRHLPELRAQAGQFFRWRFWVRGLWWQEHPFSLSAAPDGVRLRVTVKALGDHTRAVQRLRPGVRVSAEGPYGAFTAALRVRARVLLLAGGVGITPLRAMMDVLAARPGRRGDVTLVYRVSHPVDRVFAGELDWYARNRGVAVHYLIGPRDAWPPPLSAQRLHRLVPDVARRDVFLCGPPGMVGAARAALRELRVPAGQVHVEQFDL